MATNVTGFVNAALQMAAQNVIIAPKVRVLTGINYVDSNNNQQQMADINAQAWIEEHYTDELEVTNHPVAYGASISDHAYKLPPEVTLKLGWSLSPTAAGSIENILLSAAASAVPAVATLANIIQMGTAVQSVINGSAIEQAQYQNSLFDTYNQLLALQENRALFTIYAGAQKQNARERH